MTIKHITAAYVLFLMITVIILDFDLIPTPRELVQQHAPEILVAKHYPQKFLPYEDKIAHFFLVGALAFLVNLSLSLSQITIGRFRVLTGSLFLLVFVTLEEGSQAWFPSRSLSLSDLLANYAGILCFGWAAMYVIQHQEVFSKILPQRLVRLLWNSEAAVLSGQQHDTARVQCRLSRQC
jgi:VanZ family protein